MKGVNTIDVLSRWYNILRLPKLASQNVEGVTIRDTILGVCYNAKCLLGWVANAVCVTCAENPLLAGKNQTSSRY